MPLDTIIEQFLDTLWQEQGLSDNTVASYRLDLQQFSEWLPEPRAFLMIDAIDLQAFLGERLAQGYKSSSSARMLSCLRKFFRFLYIENYRQDDPTAVLASPKKAASLPKSLSEALVQALQDAPNTLDPIGLRDKGNVRVALCDRAACDGIDFTNVG